MARLALGKLPGSGAGLASQPTMSRWENAPTTRELARMMGEMIGIYCASYPTPPAAVTLDIDDTCDVVHGYQQLSFWNGHHGERCFMPIHVYYTATGRPVAMLLRTGKTPSGAEAAGHIRRLFRHIRRRWPNTHITIRGDGHYGRPEVMDFCEANGVDYVLGLPTNAVLRADPTIVTVADAGATQRAEEDRPVLRLFAETRYGATSWKHQRRVVARIEASTMGMDIRTVVTSLTAPGPEDLYEVHYCARGNAENLIKRKRRRNPALTLASYAAQQRLYFLPEPHGQGSFRPILLAWSDLSAGASPSRSRASFLIATMARGRSSACSSRMASASSRSSIGSSVSMKPTSRARNVAVRSSSARSDQYSG